MPDPAPPPVPPKNPVLYGWGVALFLLASMVPVAMIMFRVSGPGARVLVPLLLMYLAQVAAFWLVHASVPSVPPAARRAATLRASVMGLVLPAVLYFLVFGAGVPA